MEFLHHFHHPHFFVEEGTAILAATNPAVVPEGAIPVGFLMAPRIGEDVYGHDKPDVVRVVRLVMEALEVAFFLCNIFTDQYGLAKIFDIVNQILPTAYVYNTSYWVFYKNQLGESICICERFGIKCLHRRNAQHFVNLDPLPENVERYFAIPIRGKLYPTEANVSVTPITNDLLRAFEIKIDLVVQQLTVNENGFRLLNEERVALSIESRYILTPENYLLHDMALLFSPHPLTQYVFSSYFENLDQFQVYLNAHRWETHVPRTYTIVSTDLPKFTILPNDEDIPIYNVTSYYYCGFYEDYEPYAAVHGPFGISVRGGPVQKADHRSQLFLRYSRKLEATSLRNFAVRVNQPEPEEPCPTENDEQLQDSACGHSVPNVSRKSKKRGHLSKQDRTNSLVTGVPLNKNDERMAASRKFDPTIKKPGKAENETKTQRVENNFLGSGYDVMFPSLSQQGYSKFETCEKSENNNKTTDVEKPSAVILINDEDDDRDDVIFVSQGTTGQEDGTDEDIMIEEIDDENVIVIDQEEAWHIINEIINEEMEETGGVNQSNQDVVINIDENDDLNKPSTSRSFKK